MDKIKEIAKRRRQYESAMASVRMEGFEFTKEDISSLEKIIRGEITEEEFINNYKIYLSNLKKIKPELFVKGVLEF
jgi:hypothetical protein